MKLCDAAASVIYHMEAIVLGQVCESTSTHKTGFAAVPEEVSQELVPSIQLFTNMYAGWRQREPNVKVLERAMELVSIYLHLEMTPKPTMERIYRVKCKEFEQFGGKNAIELLNAWLKVKKCKKMKDAVIINGAQVKKHVKLHALLLDPSYVMASSAMEILSAGEQSFLLWDLIAMELMLKPFPYCGRLLQTIQTVQQNIRELNRSLGHSKGTFAVDTDLLQDLIEAGIWDHSCTEDLIMKALVSNLAMKEEVHARWKLFREDNEPASEYWVVWLCASIQFVQSEVEHLKRQIEQQKEHKVLSQLFSDGIKKETKWFQNGKQVLVQTIEWLKEGMKEIPFHCESMSLERFHSELLLKTILMTPSIQLPEIMVLDKPHVLEIRMNLHFCGKALAMIQALESSQFLCVEAEQELKEIFLKWLKQQRPPLKEGDAKDVLRQALYPNESKRITTFIQSVVEATEDIEQMCSLCQTFVQKLYIPKDSLLWDLFGETIIGPMLMKLLRMIHVNLRVHYQTYMELISHLIDPVI